MSSALNEPHEIGCTSFKFKDYSRACITSGKKWSRLYAKQPMEDYIRDQLPTKGFFSFNQRITSISQFLTLCSCLPFRIWRSQLQCGSQKVVWQRLYRHMENTGTLWQSSGTRLSTAMLKKLCRFLHLEIAVRKLLLVRSSEFDISIWDWPLSTRANFERLRIGEALSNFELLIKACWIQASNSRKLQDWALV